jgi:chloramphenicol O-acetyltransferase type A
MSSYLDLQNWPRREHFSFFRDYEQPFFNLCAPVEVTPLLEFTRREKLSFFLAYHYLSTKAANELEPFRYRLRGERVLVHDIVHAGTIILLEDERFTFAYFDYDTDFTRYHAQAQEVMANIRAGDGNLRPHTATDDLIHHSALPWVSFTAFSHARRRDRDDSVPKVVFGKVTTEQGRALMPLSVEVHHSLMDGLHVGRFFELFAAYCAAPEEALGFAPRANCA